MVGSLQRRCKSSNADFSTYLSEDITFDIFLLLPLKSIFKYRCVSRQWLSLLSNPSLLTKKFNSLTTSPWVFHYNSNCQERKLYSAESISPDLNSQFILEHDGFSFSFLLSKQGPLKNARVYGLASSNGLVLCSASKVYQTRYYVCNPLTKEWNSLPPPQKNIDRRWLLHGFICEPSSSPMTPTSYKVVCIPQYKDDPWNKFDVEIFSSDLGEWTTYQVSCPGDVTWDYYPLRSNLVIHNGVLYWVEGSNRILAYDLTDDNKGNGGHRCWLIDLPEKKRYDRNNGCLGELEGFISYSRSGLEELSVWVLEEDHFSSTGSWVWRLVHNITIHDMISVENCHDWFITELVSVNSYTLEPIAFNPVDQNILIVRCPSSTITFGYNIRTRLLKLLISYRKSLATYAALSPFVIAPWPTTL
ncbi:F-box domain [Macleaya cordata]|uniref:F-box domain n=1 Tax=Macleaya cordata TaxID=56857 RepID=A0A200QEQ8_MACCD|nr:F-box domain [Macleaya cordata]